MISQNLKSRIYKYSEYCPTGVSLRQMVDFGTSPNIGTLFKGSQFVVSELPVRLAHRVKELDNLPENLNMSPSIIRVKNWYAQSFDELTNLKKPNLSEESLKLLNFNNSLKDPKKYYDYVPNDVIWPHELSEYNATVTSALTKIKHRHDATVATVAQGVLEWKKSGGKGIIDSGIQSFLDRFYLSRIGIRMLIGQHIALNREPERKDYVGIICRRTNVREIALDAIDNARYICEQHYGISEAPEVELYCSKDIEFMYVPSHLMHMLFEILKNSLRATVERNSKGSYPPVRVIVAEGNEDITIKISDEGGGIPRSAMPLVWTYLYTTAHDIPDIGKVGSHDFVAPMAGLGYGISLSRLYARYFGGDLKLISMEGYGTDAYLHLNKLGSSSEPLP